MVFLLSAHEPVVVPRAVAAAAAGSSRCAAGCSSRCAAGCACGSVPGYSKIDFTRQSFSIQNEAKGLSMGFIFFILIVPFITKEHHQPTHAPMRK